MRAFCHPAAAPKPPMCLVWEFPAVQYTYAGSLTAGRRNHQRSNWRCIDFCQYNISQDAVYVPAVRDCRHHPQRRRWLWYVQKHPFS